jgi:hypothetical protein
MVDKAEILSRQLLERDRDDEGARRREGGVKVMIERRRDDYSKSCWIKNSALTLFSVRIIK